MLGMLALSPDSYLGVFDLFLFFLLVVVAVLISLLAFSSRLTNSFDTVSHLPTELLPLRAAGRHKLGGKLLTLHVPISYLFIPYFLRKRLVLICALALLVSCSMCPFLTSSFHIS
jgi:hypothetical protein